MIRNILVTGANGFIGKHVCRRLEREGYNVFRYDIENTKKELIDFVFKADFVIQLAGINRPMTVQEFYDGNANFAKTVVDWVMASGRNTPVLLSSSIQAEFDNDYGKSKKMAEDYLFNSGLPVCVFRLANVFGKWCRPNYNSVAATFCYNIAHDYEIQIRDPEYVVGFNYVDDIVDAFVDCIKNNKTSKNIMKVEPVHNCSLGKLAELLYYFKKEIESERHIPIIHNDFELKLFKTFCDYMSDEGSVMNFASDERGSFEELLKSKEWGQISENISFPNITKGEHYHTYKDEIFYVVDGKCEIKQRNIQTGDKKDDIVSYIDEKPIRIYPYYTHSIKNVGKNNSHTLMWISEVYDENKPDTIKEPVEKE